MKSFSNYDILLHLLKRCSEIRENFVSGQQLICRKVALLIDNYIIEGVELPSSEI